VKKRITPEYGKTDSAPLSQATLDWVVSMLDDTPAAKVEALVEYLDNPSSQESGELPKNSEKKIR
jgi:hypothetical protein